MDTPRPRFLRLCSLLVPLWIARSVALAQETQATRPDRHRGLRAATARCRLQVTAGPGGAPAGFTVASMRRRTSPPTAGPGPTGTSDLSSPAPASAGVATLHTWGEAERSFQLGRTSPSTPQIGDLADETGVSGTTVGELAQRPRVRVPRLRQRGPRKRARPARPRAPRSPRTRARLHVHAGLLEDPPGGLAEHGPRLGTVSYTKSAAASRSLSRWSGRRATALVSLAHQLIAAKLNVANGSNPHRGRRRDRRQPTPPSVPSCAAIGAGTCTQRRQRPHAGPRRLQQRRDRPRALRRRARAQRRAGAALKGLYR